MTTQTDIRSRALAALRKHEADREAYAEERRQNNRQNDEARLKRTLGATLDIDVTDAPVEWRSGGRCWDQPCLAIDGIHFRMEKGYLIAAVPREGCGHETWDQINPEAPWEALGDVIQGAERRAAEPCRDCAREKAPEPAEAPAQPSLGQRLEAVLRDLVADQLRAEIPF
jgi:hypothetical protein